ncbi:hypothetical protein BN3658_00256 [Coriobacteriaceae bacterium CHKCI002]|nr:hypothetical protein BN3658_00256 [Coriobacteriaceae bacterium CHKCI002]
MQTPGKGVALGRTISLFADFKHGENRITNYCGLMFKMLYQESPLAFEAVVNSLVGEEGRVRVGPLFEQQVKTACGVPDMVIRQESFQLLFEVKKSDWFHSDQLERYLDGMAAQPADAKVLFLLCGDELCDDDARFREADERAAEKGIAVVLLTFDELVKKLRNGVPCASDRLSAMVDEFEEYLSRAGVLPWWKTLFDVANCGPIFDEVKRGTYFCPDTGGGYSHRRARFFGACFQKHVRFVAEIRAVVVVGACEGEGAGGALEAKSVKWNNSGEDDGALEAEALAFAEGEEACRRAALTEDQQVFLLGHKYETDFEKDTSGGLLTKRYFWGVPDKCSSAEELACMIRGKRWSDWKCKEGC